MWTGYNWPQVFTTLEDTVVCEPVNQVAENITAHTADLSWEGLDGPAWVRYYPTGTQQYKYRSAQLNNAVSLNWLLPETEYTWEIKTICNGVWTGYDWPQVFTTLEDTVVCEPVNQVAENITAHSADLSWEGLEGPAWVRYYPTGTQQYKYRFAQLNNTVSLNWLMSETEYTWEINTICNGMWTGYDWPQAFTTLEDTVVCEPVNQVAENITAHSADLSWEGLEGPVWVRYFQAGTTQFKYRFADTSNMVNIHFLKDNTEYIWELNTLCNGMWTGYNWPQTFVTPEDTAVMGCVPENLTATEITSGSATLSWEGIQGPTYVRYFPAGTQQFKYVFTTETTVALDNLSPATDYEWQINNFCQGSWTGYNTTGTFTTLPDGDDQNMAGHSEALLKTSGVNNNTITGLYAFPNPTSQQTQITFISESEGDFSIRVMNLLGSIVQQQTHRAISGMNTLTIDLGNEKKGIYFVILNQQNNVARIKLIKR
jgi:hypothetical protein